MRFLVLGIHQSQCETITMRASFQDRRNDDVTAYGCAYDTSPAKFTGKERDAESGTTYVGARNYADTTTRWLSADPDFSKPTTPRRLNRYSYAMADPVNYADAGGTFSGPATPGRGGNPCSTVIMDGLFVSSDCGESSRAGAGAELAELHQAVKEVREPIKNYHDCAEDLRQQVGAAPNLEQYWMGSSARNKVGGGVDDAGVDLGALIFATWFFESSFAQVVNNNAAHDNQGRLIGYFTGPMQVGLDVALQFADQYGYNPAAATGALGPGQFSGDPATNVLAGAAFLKWLGDYASNAVRGSWTDIGVAYLGGAHGILDAANDPTRADIAARRRKLDQFGGAFKEYVRCTDKAFGWK